VRILFVDQTAGFEPNRKDTKPCGGILTSLSIIPKYLASKGMDVTVKSLYAENCEIDGVKYIPVSLQEALPKWDVIVLNRNGVNHPLVNYSHQIGAKVIWWLHDIVDFRYLEDLSCRNVDKVIALSKYCQESFSDFYGVDKSKFVVIPNGVDKSVYYPGKYEERKKHSLIMGSALIKGFIPVYDTWMDIKRNFPEATLTIYSSQTLHEKEEPAQYQAWLNEMELVGARVQQPIPQPILAEKMRHAWALLMPNSYPEICSNLLLQAQACGLPVISSNIGSASEFIENNKTGVITECYPHDLFWWIKKYSEATNKLFKNDELHKQISEQAPRDVKSWEEIGEEWYGVIKDLKGSN
jgi:glycosyltransferase involved in cell wall biosynthesis